MLLLWPILLIFINIVLADVEITSPKKGDKFSPDSDGKVSIDLKWKENGAPPKLNMVKYYTITLLTGANDNMERVGDLVTRKKPDDVSHDDGTYTVHLKLDAAKYASGQYFLQVYSAITEDASESTINYSPRFYFKNMPGGGSYTYTGYSYSGSSQPQDMTYYTTTVTYTLQTGVTRTAPVQPTPGTKVTITGWSRKIPTSAVTYFSTYSPDPKWKTTLTPKARNTQTSVWNEAPTKPLPSKNGGWYNPTKRQSLSARKVNLRDLIKHSISK